MPSRTPFQAGPFSGEVLAHRRQEQMLSIRVQAQDDEGAAEPQPLQTCLVIDRSGSMHGENLDMVRSASARLIRSLRPQDQVAVVAYDDEVRVVSPLAPPSEDLARKVAALEAGGSTNLYGGWLKGAKLAGKGGRVVLLSDGLANVGRFTDAASLGEHAGITRSRFGVATSTIGVGSGYDETLMSEMARQGRGFHYYAATSEAVMGAFSRERFLLSSLAAADAWIELEAPLESLRVDLGSFVGGETKTVAVPISAMPLLARLCVVRQLGDAPIVYPLSLPDTFGSHPEAEAALLVQMGAAASDQAGRVRSAGQAEEARVQLRAILLRAANHPLSGEEPLKSLVLNLTDLMEKMAGLARAYNEEEALIERKRAFQKSHNLRDPGKAFSADVEEERVAYQSRAAAYGARKWTKADAKAFSVKPKEFWLGAVVIPLKVHSNRIVVGVTDPLNGLALRELEIQVGVRIHPDRTPWDESEILSLLNEA